jgi:hypothetical protein
VSFAVGTGLATRTFNESGLTRNETSCAAHTYTLACRNGSVQHLCSGAMVTQHLDSFCLIIVSFVFGKFYSVMGPL